ncbi:MAG TPA: hypothetical protein VIK26_03110 [Clostridium sp.]
MAVKKIAISFKLSEENIYNFIMGKRSYSCYIKDLVENDMNIKNEVTTEKQLEPKAKNDNDFWLDL